MSTIKSSAENLTLNADGANNDIKFQSNGSEVASIDQAGTVTATTFTGASTDATKLPLAGGSMTGALKVTGGDLIIDQSNNGYSGTRIHDDTGGDYNTFIDLGRNQGGTRLSIRAGGRTQGTSPWQNATPATIVSFANEGIAFHGDTAAANTLDDYEEGTWTPTIVNGGSIGTVTYALYTKVGDLVSFYLYVDSMSITNNSSAFEIGGLPHQISQSPNMYGGGQVGYTHTYNWGQHGATLHVNPGGNKIYFHKNTGTTAAVTQANVQGLSYILLSGTYKSS